MTRDRAPMPIDTIPELVRLVDQARRDATPLILQSNGREVAVLVPLPINQQVLERLFHLYPPRTIRRFFSADQFDDAARALLAQTPR